MTAILLQSRLNSTRLPEKALRRLGDLTITEIAMRALITVPADYHLLVTNFQSLQKLAPLARKTHFSIFWGSDRDVLQRFCDAIRYWRFAHIIRATGDNPLVSPRMAIAALQRYRALGCDYFAYDNLPPGTGIEVVSARALLQAEGADTTPYDREHVTPFLYNNPQLFRIGRESALLPQSEHNLRVTLDTIEDWQHIDHLYRALNRQRPIEIEDLLYYQRQLATIDGNKPMRPH